MITQRYKKKTQTRPVMVYFEPKFLAEIDNLATRSGFAQRNSYIKAVLAAALEQDKESRKNKKILA